MKPLPELSDRRVHIFGVDQRPDAPDTVHWLQQHSAPAEPKTVYPPECYDMAQVPEDARVEMVITAISKGVSTLGACTIAGISVTDWFNLCAKFPALSLRATAARDESLRTLQRAADKYRSAWLDADSEGAELVPVSRVISLGALICALILFALLALAGALAWFLLR